jgi:hypothetical protein
MNGRFLAQALEIVSTVAKSGCDIQSAIYYFQSKKRNVLIWWRISVFQIILQNLSLKEVQ